MSTACNRQSTQLLGDWVDETTVGTTDEGFQLAKAGSAASINRPAVHITHWHIHHKQLILSGKRFENNDVAPFSDTFYIRQNGKKLLVLQHDSTTLRYVRLPMNQRTPRAHIAHDSVAPTPDTP